ncbi:hypothetical protein TVAG_174660 [Trichomonas vaginalis G3]|uniref:Importin N-terminal domain-containing protein n=1 Tax=Trichomonas vaginalis (strain ATCC PRA-98 / G3) TaxID=412133 RepID=A2EK13_TRIV3|nr:armadillo (ARM) repeat-containing protein family [Trichomonas vaginalis G3]EAY06997.1 hypothetical protein TVAG_174660 [Trichomonas vaginalis G3]KAI5488823.1 armadillo (ARM) repeat-containing protein family [Trichomonas vaginalis G3]|eukprot:XP_001319220.1 hypothetical protein [Trichomonas vaginalis G3]
MAVILANQVLPRQIDPYYLSDEFSHKLEKYHNALIRGLMYSDNLISSNCQELISKQFLIEQGKWSDLIGMLNQIAVSDDYSLQVRANSITTFQKILETGPPLEVLQEYGVNFVATLLDYLAANSSETNFYKSVIETLKFAIPIFNIKNSQEEFQKYFQIIIGAIANHEDPMRITDLFSLFSILCTNCYVFMADCVEELMKILTASLEAPNKYYIFGAINFIDEFSKFEQSLVQESNKQAKGFRRKTIVMHNISDLFIDQFISPIISQVVPNVSEQCPDTIEDHICFVYCDIIRNMLKINPEKISNLVISFISENISSSEWYIQYFNLLLIKSVTSSDISRESQGYLSEFLSQQLEYLTAVATMPIPLLAVQSVIDIKRIMKNYGIWTRIDESIEIIMKTLEQCSQNDYKVIIECCNLIKMMACYDIIKNQNSLISRIFIKSYQILQMYLEVNNEYSDDIQIASYNTICILIEEAPTIFHECFEGIKTSAIEGIMSQNTNTLTKISFINIISSLAKAEYKGVLDDAPFIIEKLFECNVTGDNKTDEICLSAIAQIIIVVGDQIHDDNLIDKLIDNIKRIFGYESPSATKEAIDALSDLMRKFPQNKTLLAEKEDITNSLVSFIKSDNSNSNIIVSAMYCLGDIMKFSGVPEDIALEIAKIVVEYQIKFFELNTTSKETMQEGHYFIASAVSCILGCVICSTSQEILSELFPLIIQTITVFNKQEVFEYNELAFFLELVNAAAEKYRGKLSKAVMKKDFRKALKMWESGEFLTIQKWMPLKKKMQDRASQVYEMLLTIN